MIRKVKAMVVESNVTYHARIVDSFSWISNWINGQPKRPTWTKNDVIIACETAEEDFLIKRAYMSLYGIMQERQIVSLDVSQRR
jgi:hypothetical protein